MAWVYLIIAGFGEIGFVIFMKLSKGFSRLPYTLLTGLSAFFSFYFLSKSLLDLPVGTAYGIWTGIGACGSVLLGMIFFGESKDWKRLLFIVMIIGSVIGLKVIS
jgi:quaternary ammonium compound-resistance protein SugE